MSPLAALDARGCLPPQPMRTQNAVRKKVRLDEFVLDTSPARVAAEGHGSQVVGTGGALRRLMTSLFAWATHAATEILLYMGVDRKPRVRSFI